MGTIYTITCTENGKVYIGSTKRNPVQRMKEHFQRLRNQRHSNTIMSASWCKYGEDSFVFDTIEECDDAILVEREDHYIKLLNSLAPHGLNCQTADMPEMTELTRSKMSKSKMGELNSFYGKQHTEASRARMSNSLKGRKLTDETKESISRGMTGDKNPFYGKHHSDETKRKLSEKGRARSSSAETRAKQSQSLKGRVASEATRENMAAAARARWEKVRASRANADKTTLDCENSDAVTHEE